jgi:hypothetical protein
VPPSLYELYVTQAAWRRIVSRSAVRSMYCWIEAEERFSGAIKNGVVPNRSRKLAYSFRKFRLSC